MLGTLDNDFIGLINLLRTNGSNRYFKIKIKLYGLAFFNFNN